MNLLTIDIGGMYIKSAITKLENGKYEILNITRQAFNFRVNSNNLRESLKRELLTHINSNQKLDAVLITITAETVGIFNTLSEGIIQISEICENTFSNLKVGYISVDGHIYDFEYLKNNPMNFASANWVATSNLASQYVENGLFIDIGSTTTDIIPIKNNRICPTATTDLTRLISGELVYSGILRTYICNLVNKLPYKDNFIPLAAEIRCFSAHVYVTLGLIPELEMLHPFSGIKMEISKGTSMKAIAGTVCSDINTLTCDDILKMAQYVHQKLIETIANACKRIINRCWPYGQKLKIILTGSGAKILNTSSEINAIGEIIAMPNIFEDDKNSTATALAIMATKYLI